MPLPATIPVDVLAHHDPPEGRWHEPHDRSDVGRRLLVGLALVLAMGGGALRLLPSDGRPGVVDAAGSMVLDHEFSERPDGAQGTQAADSGTLFSGSIRLDLPDRRLLGLAQIRFPVPAPRGDSHPWLLHQWGQLRATFGAETCQGPFAWIVHRGAADAGGPLNLHCDDGSVFAATALLGGDAMAGQHRYRMFVTLKDGWYVAG